MCEFFFWLSVMMIVYAYFGYPIVLIMILGVRKIKNLLAFRQQAQAGPLAYSDTELPQVSFIITAYNEEKRIEDKIKNSLLQDYPEDKLEIIVASDCSNDKTDDIVKNYETQGVKLVRADVRKGKENAQKHAVDASEGDILVFSDVATILKPDAIKNIIRNFADPTIGCVSSEDKFIDKDGNISGEGAYVKYEMFLRNLETRVSTLVGLSGSFFAARRVVCEKWEIDLQSDFNTLLNSMRIGMRGVSDSNSIGYYHNIADEKKEFQRKVRTVLRGISVLMRNLSLFNFKKYGLFSWQLFSHKLCRWMVPFFMILALLTNIIAVIQYKTLILMLVLQSIFYVTAFLYYYMERKKKKPNHLLSSSTGYHFRALLPISKLFFFFVTVNYSILVAWINYAKGHRATFWEPSKR